MKPTITFTDLIENRDSNMYSLEILARVTPSSKPIKVLSPPVALETADKGKCDDIFRMSLNQLLIAAHSLATSAGVKLPPSAFMPLPDLLSLFDVRQTVQFNNDLNKAGRDTSVIIEAIW
ncbi:hypothetical protein pETSU_124 [Edwardsiella phage pEt-SU]|uniref:Uncharacterized protein n=1 Tax=Edwardsiella phage pEt-SU TaxID=2562142 RepID=A0A4D6DWM2_9CAUD|nr:hypothetical protein HOV39_gp124 [Edwardsiella phage pEt-SU]QBZ70705.1 hypothetical protein pETSU_124 [Edwardsiella phage pEt-SU]